MGKRLFANISIEPNRFIHLVPKEESTQAHLFERDHGGLFYVNAVGFVDGFPACILTGPNGKQMVVEKRPDGIFIDEKYYAKDWIQEDGN